MASTDQVKKYLAYWFQVGKPLISPHNDQRILPHTIVVGDRYSSEFESCFQEILSPRYRDSYLEGTEQTLGELLTSRWELLSCSRCSMPIPTDELGLKMGCPCADLNAWPNVELPLPHCPSNVRSQLTLIHQRLRQRLAKPN
ncbi:hypothetical protein Lepto7376_2266 [[Leptolyngbya] sp. PCC 7376]|uniref:hypothetical protein n=1 Tax=[Leptolyngbya] sp. PCC 7376 TaxID=111781 RepID=UPI00029F27BE|nr:hypothetical protein [[Leptolyngbya] sp. PCC 7376]AFY38556.1 hypothetical protein Lepto7376_2266 [[Leptolyngbya] sp. PCC 7376]